MGWSRNTVSDKTWNKVKQADVDKKMRDFGSKKEQRREAAYRSNRSNPRNS